MGYLQEARRVLRPGGVLILITPDRRHRLLPGQKPWNRWHLREYSLERLAHTVSRVLSVESRMRMGAPDEVASHEIRRYRKTKWLTLPLTLPFMPEFLRRRGLDAMHRIKGMGGPVKAETSVSADVDFGFGEDVFVIGEDVPNPLNIVLVARKSAWVMPVVHVAGTGLRGSGYPNATETIRLLRDRLGVEVRDRALAS